MRAALGTTFALVLVTALAVVFGATSASAEPAPHAYDASPYTYDATASLSTSHTSVVAARGSPAGPGAESWVSHVSLVRCGVAANTAAGGATRFTVNSAGEATMSLRAGSTSLEVSEHAALRMTERGISIDAAEATLAQESFPYFHQGVWKAGYYDPASRVFLGSVNGEVTTVIRGASPNYIINLKAATP